MKYRVCKRLYGLDSILLVLQRYLPAQFVSIAEDGNYYCIEMHPKGYDRPPGKKVFVNELLEAAFLTRQATETRLLREYILRRVLSPYRSGKGTQ